MTEKKLSQDIDSIARFHKIYDNLPLEERKHVVLVLGDEPISWEIARNEIMHNTKRAGEILKKLIELKIV